jgi:hypothetical protein
VGNPANNGFDPKAFLAKVGAGKTILKFEKNQRVFTQGDVADAVFTFNKVGSSSLFYQSKARKRSSGFWNRASSSARGASMAIHCASRPQRRWKNA